MPQVDSSLVGTAIFAVCMIVVALAFTRDHTPQPAEVSRNKQYELADTMRLYMAGCLKAGRITGYLISVENDEKSNGTYVRLWLMGAKTPRAEVLLNFSGNGHGVATAWVKDPAVHSFYETDKEFPENLRTFLKTRLSGSMSLPPAA